MAWGLATCLCGCFGEEVTGRLIDGNCTEQQGWFRELKITSGLFHAAGLHERVLDGNR